MSDAWDKEDYEPPVAGKPVLGDRWEGEDEEENVKDNWDDDEAQEEKSSETDNAVRAIQPKKKKPLSVIIAEKEEKQKRELEEKKRKAQEQAEAETPEGRRRLQEEADLLLAKEAFGVTEVSNMTHDSLDAMNPSTKEDFDDFRKALINKISPFEKSAYFTLFLDDFFRDLSVNLDADEVKKLASTLTAVANEKVKQQKLKPKKKKGKASLKMGKDDDYNIETYENEYDDFI